MHHNNSTWTSRHYQLYRRTAVINKGLGKIQTSTTRIIHVIDINHITNTLNTLAPYVNNELKNSNKYHTLKHELVQTFSILQTLSPALHNRNTRAINIIETAWKYIAGTPDHDDLVLLQDNMNNSNNIATIATNKF